MNNKQSEYPTPEAIESCIEMLKKNCGIGPYHIVYGEKQKPLPLPSKRKTKLKSSIQEVKNIDRYLEKIITLSTN